MLTHQQRKALLFIEAEVERTGGVAPTIGEIAQRLGYLSKTHALKLVLGLEERGFIRRMPNRARAIEVVRPVSRFAAFKVNDDTKGLEPMGLKRENPEG